MIFSLKCAREEKTMEEQMAQLCALRGYATEDEVKIFCLDTLTVGELEANLKLVGEQGIPKVIFICDIVAVSPKKISFYKNLYDIDIFQSKTLSLLLRGHRLQPKFRKLTTAEKETLIEKYGKGNLPSLCYDDPMARLYDFKEGDVIEIKRKNHLYYRVVVEEYV